MLTYLLVLLSTREWTNAQGVLTFLLVLPFANSRQVPTRVSLDDSHFFLCSRSAFSLFRVSASLSSIRSCSSLTWTS